MSRILTEHQIRRIRTADAENIAKMVDQERYWTSQGLREILKRIEKLNLEDPQEANQASKSALRIARERLYGISPDLLALTLAVYGSTLRSNGSPLDAIAVYEDALAITGLTSAGAGEVRARKAYAHTCLGQRDEALEAISQALHEVVDRVPALAVRSWMLIAFGDLARALDDCLAILDLVEGNDSRNDYSLLCAIVNSCYILSFRAGIRIEASFFDRMRKSIEVYRKTLTDVGSNYYKVQFPRLMLSRSEALILMRTGEEQQAIPIFRRVARSLSKKYPDEALATYTDLICTMAKTGLNHEAVEEAKRASALLDHINFDIEPLGRRALEIAAEGDQVEFEEAIEIRMMLRPPRFTIHVPQKESLLVAG